MSGTATPDRHVCVVLHDVADATLAACERTMRAVADVALVPFTLLAVPRFHGEPATDALADWLTSSSLAGDEIALHGLTHRDDAPTRGLVDTLRRRHYTRGEGEFWSLDAAEAARRIDVGVAWFATHGWTLHGFVAPAWLLGDGARIALAAAQRFEWTATLRELVLLPEERVVQSRSVVYSTSSGWRRQMSLAWNAGVARAERDNRLLRIELHPRDADFPAVRRSWQRILERALRDRTATTVSAFMRAEGRSAPTRAPAPTAG